LEIVPATHRLKAETRSEDFRRKINAEGSAMKRSEKELRRVAEHIVTMLPEDEDDARRVCELAIQLKKWEDEEPISDTDAARKASILWRK
jgi:hypothetical protein